MNVKYPSGLAPRDEAIVAAYHLPTFFGYYSSGIEEVYLPNARTLVASFDLKSLIWDLETRDLIRIIDHHKKIRCSAMMNDGRRLVVGGANPQITIIDIDSGNIIQEFTIRDRWVRWIAIAKDDSKIVFVDSDYYGIHRPVDVIVLDLESNMPLIIDIQTKVGQYTANSNYFINISFPIMLDDHRLVITELNNKLLILLDIYSGEIIKVFEGISLSESSRIEPILSGRYFVTVDDRENTNIIVWDIDAMRKVSAWKDDGFIQDIIFSDNGYQIFTLSKNRVNVWSMPFGGLVQSISSPEFGTACSITRDAKHVVSKGFRTVSIWEIESKKRVLIIPQMPAVCSLITDTQGRRAITGLWNGEIHIIDLMTGELLQVIQAHCEKISLEKMKQIDPDIEKTNLYTLFTPKERIQILQSASETICFIWMIEPNKIISASKDGKVRAWDIKTSTMIYEFNHDEKRKWDARVVITANNDFIATAMTNHDLIKNEIRLWDIKTGKLVRILEGYARSVTALKFMPDEKRLISTGEDWCTYIWDVYTGKLLLKIFLEDWSSAVCTDDEGNHLIADSHDPHFDYSTLVKWDLKNLSPEIIKNEVYYRAKREHEFYMEDENSVTDMAISGDKRVVVTGWRDGTIRAWSVPDGKSFGTFYCRGRVNAITFIRGTLKFVTADDFGDVTVWDIFKNRNLL